MMALQTLATRQTFSAGQSTVRRIRRQCHGISLRFVSHLPRTILRSLTLYVQYLQKRAQKTNISCMAGRPAQQATRRDAILIPFLAAAAAALVPGAAQANSGAPKNGSSASMSSFTMEGTKKQGVSPKRKAKVLDKLKEKIAAGELS
jgi:hypothetical protein